MSEEQKPEKKIYLRADTNVVGDVVAPDRLEVSYWQQATRYQLIYSMAGLVLGLVCIVAGVVLFLNGVTGSTSWIAKILGAESNLSDAPPGVVIFIVGLFVVWVTRYYVKPVATTGNKRRRRK